LIANVLLERRSESDLPVRYVRQTGWMASMIGPKSGMVSNDLVRGPLFCEGFFLGVLVSRQKPDADLIARESYDAQARARLRHVDHHAVTSKDGRLRLTDPHGRAPLLPPVADPLPPFR